MGGNHEHDGKVVKAISQYWMVSVEVITLAARSSLQKQTINALW